MPRHSAVLGTFTVSSGTDNITITNADFNTKLIFGGNIDVIVYCPATLPETVYPQISWLESPTASDWRYIDVGGTRIVCAAANALVCPIGSARALRLYAPAGAVAADRAFIVSIQLES